MSITALKTALLASALAFGATGVARADCESDLLQLEAAYKSPNLSTEAKAAFDVAKTKAVAALKKDDDKTCNAAITEALASAAIKPAEAKATAVAAPAPTAATGPLGDLSAYRSIAEDTLRIVKTGKLDAAEVGSPTSKRPGMTPKPN